MSDVGICGNTITPIAGTSAPLVCDLPAGHDGWHGCDNPSGATRCHWTERDESDAHHEGFGAGVEWADKDRDDAIAAAERRGYDRAVAALRDRGYLRYCLAQGNCGDWTLHAGDYLATVRAKVLGAESETTKETTL